MSEWKQFPLGLNNAACTEFKSLLRRINQVNPRRFQIRIEYGNLNLYVQAPYENMMGPYLYIDDTALTAVPPTVRSCGPP